MDLPLGFAKDAPRLGAGCFTASGAVTIMAARLAHYAREGQILVGDETARRIRSLFSLNHPGKVTLKNIQDSGEVYETHLPSS